MRHPIPGLPRGGGRSDDCPTGNSATGEDFARQQPAERITVALIQDVREDLQSLQDRTDLSKTDVVNRAITLYEFIDVQLRKGRDVLIRDNNTGEILAVRIF